jgi:hypothetical protein
VGTLPILSLSIASEPQSVTPGYGPDQSWIPVPSGSGADDHLVLHVHCPPIPLTQETTVLSFLINAKLAAYFQIKYPRFGEGGWIDATLSLLEAKERHGIMLLSFRLASAMADALTNT